MAPNWCSCVKLTMKIVNAIRSNVFKKLALVTYCSISGWYLSYLNLEIETRVDDN